MLNVGIDRISVYTSRYYLDLALLAKARGVDPQKYLIGLGQEKMAVCAPDEDIVTLAANAAERVLLNENLADIDTLLFATETGIDQSKAAGVYLKNWLKLPNQLRVIEMKQACYSATAALQLASAWVARHPSKKVLIVAADIARYGLNTAGESSQGAGAVAMLVSANPRILIVEPEAGLYTEDIMDFWRPNYRDEALVDGHYSTKIYLEALAATWNDYQQKTGREFNQHDYFCYHTPVPRLVEKAHEYLAQLNHVTLSREAVHAALIPALHYGRLCGNAYSAALYISFASLLDQTAGDLSQKRVGFYSYGSGCVAEFFSGIIQPNYQKFLDTTFHREVFAQRQALTYPEYEAFYAFRLPQNGGECHTPHYQTNRFRLAGIKDHKRIYEKIDAPVVAIPTSDRICAKSPGKLILSGEHSVVYGRPALAIAIDRYAQTIVSAQEANHVSFNLKNFGYSDSFTLTTLREMKQRVKNKYKQFLKGDARIRDVLQTPFELTQYALTHWLDHLNAKNEPGIDLYTQSTIPVGCGLGSSAASILSVLRAMAKFYDIELRTEDYLKLAIEAEQLQHGQTSGLDLLVSLSGGCVYFKDGKIETRPAPKVPMSLINTGTPTVTTGECVTHVAERFAHHAIWNTFETVTHIMDQALQANDLVEVQAAIRDNHALLTQIGVVPLKIQQFIQALEQLGFAAKICGAGAISGETAGALWVVGAPTPALHSLCQQYQYELSAIAVDVKGLHVSEV